MKRTIVFRVFLVAFLVILPQVALSQTVPSQAFDDYVNKAIKDWDVPGVAIAVINDDRVIFARGYGVRELGKPATVDENTLFAIGSSSKAFTAAALAMLVDEGKLKWEDPATKYLPGFQLFDPYSTRELTVSDVTLPQNAFQVAYLRKPNNFIAALVARRATEIGRELEALGRVDRNFRSPRYENTIRHAH